MPAFASVPGGTWYRVGAQHTAPLYDRGSSCDRYSPGGSAPTDYRFFDVATTVTTIADLQTATAVVDL